MSLDMDLLTSVRVALSRHPSIYWIVGGACSGKSAVCARLSNEKGIPVYDMDAHIFGDYMPRYTRARHPACKGWFDRPDGLEWILSLAWEQFNRQFAAMDVEYLDLFAEDVLAMDPERPLLVDGGISHPAILAQVLSSARIVCLTRPESDCRRAWETDEKRAGMKSAVLALPAGQAAWERFLSYDSLLTRTLVRECLEKNIKTLACANGQDLANLANLICANWKL